VNYPFNLYETLNFLAKVHSFINGNHVWLNVGSDFLLLCEFFKQQFPRINEILVLSVTLCPTDRPIKTLL